MGQPNTVLARSAADLGAAAAEAAAPAAHGRLAFTDGREVVNGLATTAEAVREAGWARVEAGAGPLIGTPVRAHPGRLSSRSDSHSRSTF